MGQVLALEGTPPVVSGAGKLIVVSLSEQHLWAYQGRSAHLPFVARSGLPLPTRARRVRIQSKIPNAYGSAWDLWMPWWMGIYWAGSTENGIHALPILSNGQTLWEGYLGTPVSYGCVVLGTAESKLLYDWAGDRDACLDTLLDLGSHLQRKDSDLAMDDRAIAQKLDYRKTFLIGFGFFGTSVMEAVQRLCAHFSAGRKPGVRDSDQGGGGFGLAQRSPAL